MKIASSALFHDGFFLTRYHVFRVPQATSSSSTRILRNILNGFAWLVLLGLTVWSAAAIYFDLNFLRSPILSVSLYVVVIAVIAYAAKSFRKTVPLVGFLIVLFCWRSLKPSNDRVWQPELAETPWAEIDGDRVTIHNFRHCYYRQLNDFTCDWLTKTVSLSQVRGMDLFVDYWGSPWIEHPIVSFRFGDDDYVAASIEARYQIGQGYSPIRSFFRQFTLVYVLADERDLIRLRTNYRSGEQVFLFHLNASPEWTRQLFLQYLWHANDLHVHPQWFNAANNNCTTNIFEQMAATGHLPKDTSRYSWWILLNGRAPEMLYRGGNFAGNLSFAELQQQALINPLAKGLGDVSDFSRRIRMNRAGFESQFEPDEGSASPPQ